MPKLTPDAASRARILRCIEAGNFPRKVLATQGPYARAACRGCASELFVGFMRGGVCNSCRRAQRKEALQCAPLPSAALRLRVRALWADKENYPPDFNVARMERRLRTAGRLRLGTLQFLQKNGFAARVPCCVCRRECFVYEFGTSTMRKRGFMAHCMRCKRERVDLVYDRVRGAVYRMKSAGCFSEDELRGDPQLQAAKSRLEGVVRRALAAQNSRCFYTFIPLELRDRDHPFCVSIERLDRGKMYLDRGNVALVAAILNVGGTANWSRRLSLQLLFAPLVECIPADDALRRAFCAERVRECRARARVRESRPDRYRERASHAAVDIDADFLLALLQRQRGRCALSGLPLACARRHPFSLSVDRIDNAAGYARNNVRLVIGRLNVGAQWVWTDALFSEFRARLERNADRLLVAEGLAPLPRGESPARIIAAARARRYSLRSRAPLAGLVQYLNERENITEP